MSRLHAPLSTIAAVLTTGSAFAGAGPEVGVLWRFEMPSDIAGAFVSVGADGTVYATDNLHLYALTPDGELLWSMAGAGGGRPITFAGDGTIYTSAGGTGIRAINPDGTLIWEFWPPDILPLLAGPNLGSDGNLYGVQDTVSSGGGLGAFSLDAGGELRWSDQGVPRIFNTDGGSNSNIVFGADRLFAGVIGANGPPATYAFDLDGDQVWYSGGVGLSIAATSYPRLMVDGRIVFRLASSGLMAVQQDGTVDWEIFHPGLGTVIVDPAVGTDGVIYTGKYSGVQLWAVSPGGTTVWVRTYESNHWLQAVGVAPGNRTLVATGTPGWVRGYDPANGDQLWQVDLDPEEGLPQIPRTEVPAFSLDGDTVYITTGFVGNGVGHSYVYAIGPLGSGCAGDLATDGQVGINDLLALLAAWGPCAGCPADMDGDGVVGINDFLSLLGAWGPCPP